MGGEGLLIESAPEVPLPGEGGGGFTRHRACLHPHTQHPPPAVARLTLPCLYALSCSLHSDWRPA